ncbi:tripartite motif-containing protein 2-like [Haliotis cracherodii]|uniref:tripartite motif-containing protein 2-like n=1 Tax=Haliotis cracherodii TaxID=6455 RepID=UPI0039EB14DF
MATSQKLTEHFLTCTICTEVFDKPCTLVCNHTFCRKCVVTYTKTRPEAISAKSLLCPLCRKMTKVSAPERPVEEWADDVKPIFVIQGLLDSFGPESKDTINCSFCKEEGETTPATSWCSACDDALCELCMRVHKLITLFRHRGAFDLSPYTKVKVRKKIICKVHKDEKCKYICKDCKTAVCQTCCTNHHRKCDLVVEIESEIPAMKTELKENKEDLLKKHDEMKTHVGKQDTINVLDLKATPVLQGNINVRVAGYADISNPSDMTVLVVNGTDTVVVTDYSNNSVKSFYTRNKKQSHSRLSLGGRPYGITKLKDNQVAVTVLGARHIVTVQVNPDLVLLSTITTSKRYYGITSLTPATLAAGSDSPPCVDILDMVGHVLRSIFPGQPSRYTLKYPFFLCTTRTGNILVSDCGSKCVVCLTPEGDVVFTYRPTGDTEMEYPHGITSTSTGDILLTDINLHRVLHLTESGQFVRNILTSQDGVQSPRSKMATSQKLTEHFLTCTICTEVFDKPCTLVCYHTFCRKCVVNYTKTRPEAISAKSLLCPFCSKMTKVSAPERPVEEWADDVKPSFVIQGLLDSFGPGSKDTTDCSYCTEEGETTPATSWCSVCDDALCERCLRMHKRMPFSRHHDVVDLSGETKVRVKRKVMCKVHKDENIKYICKDCKTAVCQTCCTIHHRKCDLVVEIESEIPAMKTELRRNKEDLLKKHDEMKTHIGKQNVKVHEALTLYLQIESNIKSASVKAMEVIKVKERTLLAELKEMSDRHIGELKADIKSGEISVQMYQQQAELLDQTLQSECDMDVYEMYQGCEAGDVEAVGVADVKEKGRIARIMLRQDTDKLSRALDDLQLGEIDVLYEGVLDLKAAPVLQDTINVKLAGDTMMVLPIDVTVLLVNGTDTVVFTDNNNNSVKSFYTRNKQHGHSRLRVGGAPFGITKLKDNQVAVTVPDTREIVTVQVNPDLVLLSTITGSKEYRGITSLTPSTLAASSIYPPCVDVLDMTGHVLKSIRPNHPSRNILKNPNFLCTTRTGNILVCDCGSKCVVCLTPEGDVVFTYRPTGDTSLKYPRGITSTSTGDILVTDSDLHRVLHLTESGQFVRTILTSQDGVQSPGAVSVGRHGRMYVCLWDEVKVFTLN